MIHIQMFIHCCTFVVQCLLTGEESCGKSRNRSANWLNKESSRRQAITSSNPIFDWHCLTSLTYHHYYIKVSYYHYHQEGADWVTRF